MAVNSPASSHGKNPSRPDRVPTATARRLSVGANVMVTLGLALVVVCLVNWFGQRYHYRRDLSRLGAYRLSERTRRVLDRVTTPVRLTAVYTSDEPEKARQRYLPRIRDLFEEMALRSDLLKAEIIRTDEQKRALEKRLRDAFALQAEEHLEALAEAEQLQDEMTNVLQTQAALLAGVRDSGAWLSAFSSFTNIIANLNEMARGLADTRKEVASLTQGEVLPDYTQAENKIEQSNNQIKTVLAESKRWFEEMSKLIEAHQQGRIAALKELPQHLEQMRQLVLALGQAVGAPGDEMPPEPTESLRSFGRAAGELATFLAAQSARLQDLTERYPVIVENPHWSVQVTLLGPLGARMGLPDMILQEQQQLAGLRPQIAALLKQDLEPNQARVALERVRNLTLDTQHTLKAVADQLALLPEHLASVDEPTRDLLAGGQTVETFAGLISRLDELNTKIADLPEIESGTVGHTLKRDNTIVVEMDRKVKVVGFDDVWPIQYQDFSIPGRAGDIERAFNGDSAISAALLTLTEDKPVGTVIMVGFEPELPPELRQFVRPYAGTYPTRYYEVLRQELTDAHFVVKPWNLAAQDSPPEPEEGTEPIYLVPPPAEFLVPPFVRQQGMDVPQLDEAKKQNLYDAIGPSGRAVFLVNYAPPQSARMGPFGTGPVSQHPYPYEDYLKKTWGLETRNKWRVIMGLPDPRKPGYFGVSAESYAYMSINNFSRHPIGEPFRARRVPMLNICPVGHAEQIPEGVTLDDVLTVPAADNFWAVQNIEDLVRAVLDPESRGLIRKDLDPADGFMDLLPPFPVIVAARNDQGGRIVVGGQAESLMDGYLKQPIPRGGGKKRISFDPPPRVNADLVVNCVYWVCGREELIGAGPLVTPVLEPLEPGVKTTLSLAVTGWAFLALVVGAVVMFVRRK